MVEQRRAPARRQACAEIARGGDTDLLAEDGAHRLFKAIDAARHAQARAPRKQNAQIGIGDQMRRYVRDIDIEIKGAAHARHDQRERLIVMRRERDLERIVVTRRDTQAPDIVAATHGTHIPLTIDPLNPRQRPRTMEDQEERPVEGRRIAEPRAGLTAVRRA